MSACRRLSPLLCALFLAAPAELRAQDWQAEWNSVLAKSKGQLLALAFQQSEGMSTVIDVFQKKFPDIKVQRTESEPSQMAPRLVTEQKNGLFVWDSWWATAANMNDVVLPADGFDSIADYLILPEVKDPANWRDPRFLHTSAEKPYIFIHSNYLSNNALYNTALFPPAPFALDQLLDPKLAGRISVRVPARPHGGTMMLAVVAKAKGIDFVRRLLTDQKPRFIDSDRQVTTELMNGGSAVAFGTTSADLYAQCVADGGCTTIKPLPISYMHSRSVAVMKHAPHKEATKVWVNWLLSREGQEAYVRDYARSSSFGAVSMRKDVAPHPDHLASVPDFAHLDSYVAVSFPSGGKEMSAIADLYKSIRP